MAEEIKNETIPKIKVGNDSVDKFVKDAGNGKIKGINKPQILIKNIEKRQVFCPYCQVGTATLMVHNLNNGEVELQDMKSPHKCNHCGKFFMFKLAMRVVGIEMAEV